jgi:hypothetical protein
MEIRIDHVTVCGPDLDDLVGRLDRAGIPPKYGGAHANGLTHMALAGFEDGSYLELIAPMPNVDRAKATGMLAGWLPLMVENAGAGAWAIRVDDIGLRTSELRDRGIAVRGPEKGGRERPDGVRLEWQTTIAGPGAPGSLLPFMIEDTTDRTLRVQRTAHPLGVRGVAAVVLNVLDLDRAAALFQRAYNWGSFETEDQKAFAARIARFPGNPVVLAEGHPGSWLRKRAEKLGECPVAFLLTANAVLSTETASWLGIDLQWLEEARIGDSRIGLVSSAF